MAFLPFPELRFPRNNREFFLSRELTRRQVPVLWLLPESGRNLGVELAWPLVRFPDMDVRGRTYLLPCYLGWRLRRMGVRCLWLSGWGIRALPELFWMMRILAWYGIRVVYDPIDPICEFGEAHGQISPTQLPECVVRARRVYRASSLTLSVTPELRDLLVEHGAPPDRVAVARWGTDVELFDPARTRCDLKQTLGLSSDTFLVGWLGSMEPFKGLREIVMPVAEGLAAQGRPAHFVVAGRGMLEAEVRTWAASRPDIPVTVLPSIAYSDAPSFTGSLDAYLVPTNPASQYARSICPVKCFDAAAMGTPLIITRTPATAFLEQSSAKVQLVDFTPGSFIQALRRLMDRQTSSPDDRTRTRSAIMEHSHQQVSVLLADRILASLGLNPGTPPRRRAAGGSR